MLPSPSPSLGFLEHRKVFFESAYQGLQYTKGTTDNDRKIFEENLQALENDPQWADIFIENRKNLARGVNKDMRKSYQEKTAEGETNENQNGATTEKQINGTDVSTQPEKSDEEKNEVETQEKAKALNDILLGENNWESDAVKEKVNNYYSFEGEESDEKKFNDLKISKKWKKFFTNKEIIKFLRTTEEKMKIKDFNKDSITIGKKPFMMKLTKKNGKISLNISSVIPLKEEYKEKITEDIHKKISPNIILEIKKENDDIIMNMSGDFLDVSNLKFDKIIEVFEEIETEANSTTESTDTEKKEKERSTKEPKTLEEKSEKIQEKLKKLPKQYITRESGPHKDNSDNFMLIEVLDTSTDTNDSILRIVITDNSYDVFVPGEWNDKRKKYSNIETVFKDKRVKKLIEEKNSGAEGDTGSGGPKGKEETTSTTSNFEQYENDKKAIKPIEENKQFVHDMIEKLSAKEIPYSYYSPLLKQYKNFNTTGITKTIKKFRKPPPDPKSRNQNKKTSRNRVSENWDSLLNGDTRNNSFGEHKAGRLQKLINGTGVDKTKNFLENNNQYIKKIETDPYLVSATLYKESALTLDWKEKYNIFDGLITSLFTITEYGGSDTKRFKRIQDENIEDIVSIINNAYENDKQNLVEINTNEKYPVNGLSAMGYGQFMPRHLDKYAKKGDGTKGGIPDLYDIKNGGALLSSDSFIKEECKIEGIDWNKLSVQTLTQISQWWMEFDAKISGAGLTKFHGSEDADLLYFDNYLKNKNKDFYEANKESIDYIIETAKNLAYYNKSSYDTLYVMLLASKLQK